ncbi:MAG: penicillin-binding protein 2 [Candidatus Puniceispirillum sp.]
MSKKGKKDLRRAISRRGLLLAGGQLALTGLLAGRLYQLQVAQSSRYKGLSDRNQFDMRVVSPRRGRLYDRNMRLLAGNAESFQLRVTPLFVDDLERTLASLLTIVDLTPEQITNVLDTAKKVPSFQDIVVRDDLSQRELARLAVRSALLSGVSFGRSLRRIYPQGILGCHVTGYVSPVTRNEIEADQTLRALPDLGTGKIGVEFTHEQRLRGVPGRERIEVNAKGQPIRVFQDVAASAGQDLRLSLDMGIQLHAADALRQGRLTPVKLGSSEVQKAIAENAELRAHIAVGDEMILRDEKKRLVPPDSGAAVVIDVETGGIVSLVSAPMFDPNLFTGRLLTRDWQRLNNHPRTPLLNRAISGLYAPGSTFKMVVGLAALEAGVISQKTRFSCPGHMELGNAKFHCWRKDGHGAVNLVSALEQSCDVFFYEIALKTGIKKIKDMARRLGLGDSTGLDLPGEKSGIVPSHEWKLAHHGKVWTPGETVVAGIGQGYVLATPLQLAVMTARIANGRKAVTPRLLTNDMTSPDDFAPLDIAPAALDVVRQGMVKVMYGGLGTARTHKLADTLGGMAGKTGTVQVKRITKAQREAGIISNIDRPWAERDHALFVAYAPIKKPRYAIAVVVEHGGSGSAAAAPVARDIMAKTIKTLGVA